MLTILANGTLIDCPVERRNDEDVRYATCNMHVPDDNGHPVLVSVVAFKLPVVTALLALRQGSSCAIAGRATVKSWEREGGAQHGLFVVADRVV
jgi:single-stranded DNA-binding protein